MGYKVGTSGHDSGESEIKTPVSKPVNDCQKCPSRLREWPQSRESKGGLPFLPKGFAPRPSPF